MKNNSPYIAPAKPKVEPAIKPGRKPLPDESPWNVPKPKVQPKPKG